MMTKFILQRGAIRLSLPIALFLSILILYPMATISIKALADFYQYQKVVDQTMTLTLPRFHFFLKNRMMKAYLRYTSKTPLDDEESPLVTFDITINPNHLNQLNSNLPESGKQQYFNAFLKIIEAESQNKSQKQSNAKDAPIKKIKLRYRGDNNYHWLYDKKSLRIKIRNDVYHMDKTFNLINPIEMNSFRDVINYSLAKKMGLLAPDSYPVRVKINGEYRGVYLYLSQVDENLLRKHKRMPGSLYYGELKTTDNQGTVWSKQENWTKKASRNKEQKNNREDISLLIHALNNSSQVEFVTFTEKYLNKQAFFKFIALDRLVGSHHHDFYHNHKIYFDPYLGKFEPIAWDVRFWSNQPQKDRSLYPIQLKLASHPPYDAAIDKMVYQQIQQLGATGISKQYQQVVQSIKEDLSRDIYRDTASHRDYISDDIVSQPFPIARFEAVIAKDQQLIMQRLNTLKTLYETADVSYAIKQTSQMQFKLQIQVSGNNPITINLSSIHPSIKVQLVEKVQENSIGWLDDKTVILYPGRIIKEQSQTFLPQDFYGHQTVQPQTNTYHFLFKQTGEDILTNSDILNKIQLTNYISGQEINLKQIKHKQQFSELKMAKTKKFQQPNKLKKINLSGTIEVLEDQVYPKNTQVSIEPGTRFIFHPKKSLYFYGKVLAIGNKQQPIVFMAKNPSKPWGVVAIQGQAASGSQLSYCQISDGSIATKNLINYTAPLNIHDVSDFKVNHCLIGRNHLGDDAMHIAYAKGKIENNVFKNARSDALDIDIAVVEVNNNYFEQSGNDALDIMTTELYATKNIFKFSGDKGISVGEWSTAYIQQSIFEGNNIGLEVKDQSIVEASELIISQSKTKAINLYHKNKRYKQGGQLRAKRIALISNDQVSVDDASLLTQFSRIDQKVLFNEPWYKELTNRVPINLEKSVKTTADSYSTESKGFLKNVSFTRRVTTNKAKILQNSLNFQHSSNPRYVPTEFSRIKITNNN